MGGHLCGCPGGVRGAGRQRQQTRQGRPLNPGCLRAWVQVALLQGNPKARHTQTRRVAMVFSIHVVFQTRVFVRSPGASSAPRSPACPAGCSLDLLVEVQPREGAQRSREDSGACSLCGHLCDHDQRGRRTFRNSAGSGPSQGCLPPTGTQSDCCLEGSWARSTACPVWLLRLSVSGRVSRVDVSPRCERVTVYLSFSGVTPQGGSRLVLDTHAWLW